MINPPPCNARFDLFFPPQFREVFALATLGVWEQMRLAGKRPRIPHVLQSHNWDCGLACVEMAMRALGVAPHECSLRTLRTRVPSTSVWTVDLVHIICSFGVKFRFLTTTIGVNPLYKNEVCDSGPRDLPNPNLTRTLALASRRPSTTRRWTWTVTGSATCSSALQAAGSRLSGARSPTTSFAN